MIWRRCGYCKTEHRPTGDVANCPNCGAGADQIVFEPEFQVYTEEFVSSGERNQRFAVRYAPSDKPEDIWPNVLVVDGRAEGPVFWEGLPPWYSNGWIWSIGSLVNYGSKVIPPKGSIITVTYSGLASSHPRANS